MADQNSTANKIAGRFSKKTGEKAPNYSAAAESQGRLTPTAAA